jgi:hypothetical protein
MERLSSDLLCGEDDKATIRKSERETQEFSWGRSNTCSETFSGCVASTVFERFQPLVAMLEDS